ncbi:hypothetical protein SAMD00019534_015260 [Acytostelium subglobosum LB1]|uniref:hypothetical protein n=1 Tax=Acytostelium subglobosum LB1 TaxID=1410327 RepID=UPI000644F813|nr:hypothetical protein SAMD00019534_015260 [Acytostelium subglobosum LB1]GAM18351.1 hypothetical protein SAMD00019534_015260 [Acytostelium subglobosum LB1]|eukprot:XP_012757571.1 hypothetical protein SAMD00019534_015260 [Acytostelium subglobosum LB1]
MSSDIAPDARGVDDNSNNTDALDSLSLCNKHKKFFYLTCFQCRGIRLCRDCVPNHVNHPIGIYNNRQHLQLLREAATAAASAAQNNNNNNNNNGSMLSSSSSRVVGNSTISSSSGSSIRPIDASQDGEMTTSTTSISSSSSSSSSSSLSLSSSISITPDPSVLSSVSSQLVPILPIPSNLQSYVKTNAHEAALSGTGETFILDIKSHDFHRPDKDRVSVIFDFKKQSITYVTGANPNEEIKFSVIFYIECSKSDDGGHIITIHFFDNPQRVAKVTTKSLNSLEIYLNRLWHSGMLIDISKPIYWHKDRSRFTNALPPDLLDDLLNGTNEHLIELLEFMSMDLKEIIDKPALLSITRREYLRRAITHDRPTQPRMYYLLYIMRLMLFDAVEYIKEDLMELLTHQNYQSCKQLFHAIYAEFIEIKGDTLWSAEDLFANGIVFFDSPIVDIIGRHYTMTPEHKTRLILMEFGNSHSTLSNDKTLAVFKEIKHKQVFLETFATLFWPLIISDYHQRQEDFLSYFFVSPRDFFGALIACDVNSLTDNDLGFRFNLAMYYIEREKPDLANVKLGHIMFELLSRNHVRFYDLLKQMKHQEEQIATIMKSIDMFIENSDTHTLLDHLEVILRLLKNARLSWLCSPKVMDSITHTWSKKYMIYSVRDNAVYDRLQAAMMELLRLPDYGHLYIRIPTLFTRKIVTMVPTMIDITEISREEHAFRSESGPIINEDLNERTRVQYYQLCSEAVQQVASKFSESSMSSLISEVIDLVRQIGELARDHIPISLPHLLLLNRFLTHINNHRLIKDIGLKAPLHRLIVNSRSWRKDVLEYVNLTNEFQHNLKTMYQRMASSWNPDHSKEFDVISDVLASTFGQTVIRSSTLNETHYKHLWRLSKLMQLVEWLNTRFDFTIKAGTNNLNNPSSACTMLCRAITSAKGAHGHTLISEELVDFLSNLLGSDNNRLFRIVLDHYISVSKSVSIDNIAILCRDYLKALIDDDDSSLNLKLNVIKNLAMTKDINFNKEYRTLFSIIYPNEQYDGTRNRLEQLINEASLNGVQDNINYLFTYCDSNQHYIIVDNFDNDKRNIQAKVSNLKSDLTIGEAKQLVGEVTSLIGGLNHHQLQLFQHIDRELIDFYASFDDFIKTNQIITANLISDQFNFNLMNNTIHSYEMLKPLIIRCKAAKKGGFKDNQTEHFVSLSDLCRVFASTNNNKNSRDNIETTINKLVWTVTNISQIKSLYSAASGMHDTESVLSTAKEIFNGSKFQSSSPKNENGLLGWCVVIDSSKITLPQFKVMDVVQGLRISTSDTQFQSNELIDMVDRFGIAVEHFVTIHELHCQLDRAFHPQFSQGFIEIPFNGLLDTLEDFSAHLRKMLEHWTSMMNSLPARLFYLRPHGISSLLSGFTSMAESPTTPTSRDFVSLLSPYIKFCHQSLRDTSSVDKTLLSIHNDMIKDKTLTTSLKFNIHMQHVLSRLATTDVFYEELDFDRGPMFVELPSHQNLFNTLMYLNNSQLPHPSQIFYANKFSDEHDCMFKLAEQMAGHTLFLVGIPSDRNVLLKWLSHHFSKGTQSSLARIYIIATEPSNTNSTFGFLPQYKGMIDTEWKNFKELLATTKLNTGVEKLTVVCGRTGTGKSFMIQQELPKLIRVNIRPNYDVKPLIDMLKGLMASKDRAKEQPVGIHLDISPYCNFAMFELFLYHLVHGFVIGNRLGEMISTSGSLSLHIYIEIGDPPLDSNHTSYEHYLSDNIPLTTNIATRKDHTTMRWKDDDADYEVFMFARTNNKLQKPSIKMGDDVTFNEYINHARELVKATFNYSPHFINDPQCLQHRRSFLVLMQQRVRFLMRYYDYYAEMGLAGRSMQRKMLMPYELYQYFLYEAMLLADQNLLSSAVAFNNSTPNAVAANMETLWHAPPMFIARTEHENNTSIEFLDFHALYRHKQIINQITYDEAINSESTSKFRAFIANLFGVGRSELIINLCHQFNYVLTPESGLILMTLYNKMLCQRSIILTGDTGVGKTYTLLFFSMLINAKVDSMPDIISRVRGLISDIFKTLPKFELRGSSSSQDSRRELPKDPSVHQIIDAMSQMCDYEGQSEEDRDKMFLQVEKAIRLLLLRSLIYAPPNSFLQVLSTSKRREIKSKERCVEAIKEICTASFKNIFHRIVMHQKFTSLTFKSRVLELVKESSELFARDPNLKMVVFVDEFNTSPPDTLSLINEILTNGTIDGSQLTLPSNIFWVAAMNPRNMGNNNTNNIDYTGQQQGAPAFVVENAPPSTLNLLLNVGEFTEKNEKTFVQVLFQLNEHMCTPYHSGDLSDFILIGQKGLRRVGQTRTHVSIRDITRAIDFYQFFRTPVGQSILQCARPNKLKDGDLLIHWMSIVAAIGLTYHLRVLPSNVNANKFLQVFNKYYTDKAPPIVAEAFPSFEMMFANIIDGLCDQRYTKLPPGVALTQSLKRNIFCITVAINCSVPLCIVGPPGCSKTLSFSIVIDNLNETKHTNSASPWSLMKNADPFRYQCTPHTTDVEIASVFERALGRQRSYDSSQGSSRCVVFIDEAGLVNEDESPMKVMHDYLDRLSQKMDNATPDISTIILSNKILDAAKTNRMLMLVHPEGISDQDEMSLVKGCYFNNAELGDAQHRLSVALCSAFKAVPKFDLINKDQHLFHQRDFVFFLRHLARGVKQNYNMLSPQVLLNSLERNFGGIDPDQQQLLVKAFFEELAKVDDAFKTVPAMHAATNTIERLKDSLCEVMSPDQHPSTYPFRYVMLIDPTENETSLAILNELDIKHSVIRVGTFPDDTANNALVQAVSRIKRAMKEGQTIVLVNSTLIDSCFYEVFNRHFTLLTAADGTVQFMANVSFGTNSIYCTVHPNFKLIVHLPESKLQHTQAPWLNRFEKYYISIEQMRLHYIQHNNLMDQNEHLTKLLKSADHFVSSFKPTMFAGYSATETISSLVYSSIKGYNLQGRHDKHELGFDLISSSSTTAGREKDNDIFQQLNFKLLQLARPECVFTRSTLPTSYINEYILKQEHFNVVRFLDSLLTRKLWHGNDTSLSNRWSIITRTSLTLGMITADKLTDLLPSFQDQYHPGMPDIHNKMSVIQLNGVKSTEQCQKLLEQFINSTQLVLVVVADMSSVSQHQITYIHQWFREHGSQDDNADRMFVNICHYPPEYSLSSNSMIKANFVNGMDHIYIDSFGVRVDGKLMESSNISLDSDIRNWIANAFGLEVQLDPIELENTFSKMFFGAMHQTAIHSVNLNQMSQHMVQKSQDSQSVKQFYSNSKDRARLTVELFEKHRAWRREAILKFTNQLDVNSLITDIIENTSRLIQTGMSITSFIDSIKNSLESHMYAIVSRIFDLIANLKSFGNVSMIPADIGDPRDALITLYIRSIEAPEPSAYVEDRYEQRILSIPASRFDSTLPIYAHISKDISTLFDRTLAQQASQRTLADIFAHFVKLVHDHPINAVISHINNTPSLFDLYVSDFIVLTMSFPKQMVDLIKMIVGKTLPGNVNNILAYSVCNHFQADTFHFLNCFALPHVKLGSDNNQDVIRLLESSLSPTMGVVVNNIIDESMAVLYTHIRSIDISSSDIIELTTNWCVAVREVLNRTSIDTMLARQVGSVRDKTTYVFVMFKVAVDFIANRTPNHVDITDHSLKQSLTTMYSHFKQAELTCERFVQTFTDSYGRKLTGLKLGTFLDIVEPFVALSPHNQDHFLKLCNHDVPHPFGKTIPLGWSSTMLKNFMPSMESFKPFINAILDQHQFKGSTMTNPYILCLMEEGKISQKILDFMQLKVDVFTNNFKPNIPLVDSLYFVLLEDCRVNYKLLSTDDLSNVWREEVTKKDNYSRINLFAISTYIIDRLAQSLNDDPLEGNIKWLHGDSHFCRILKTLLDIQSQAIRSPHAMITKTFNRIHLFNRIKTEFKLFELLNCMPLLELIGIKDCHVSVVSNPVESTYFDFVVDRHNKDNKDALLFSQLDAAVRKQSDSMVASLLQLCADSNSSRTRGFLRMSMFLITFQLYMEGKQMDFVRKLVKVGSTFNEITENNDFHPYFEKIIDKRLNPSVQYLDSILIQAKEGKDGVKSPDTLINAQLLVNFVAASIGSSNNNYLYHLTRDTHNLVAGKLFPATETLFRDCGIKYRLQGEDTNTYCMNGNTLFKYMIGASIWGAFAWTVSLLDGPNNKDFKHLTNQDTHFANYLQDHTVVGLTDYVGVRSFTQVFEIRNNEQVAEKHIDTGHFLSELVYNIWDTAYTKPNPTMRSVFASDVEVSQYEDHLTFMIERLLKYYPGIKQKRIRDIITHSDEMGTITSIRAECARSFSTPFYTYELIHEQLTKSNNKLLLFFTTNITKLCISRYFNTLVRFMQAVFKHFTRRLPKHFINLPFLECVDYLANNRHVDQGTIDQLKQIWERLKSSWDVILRHLNIMEGGCQQLPDYERVQQSITDDMPLDQSAALTRHWRWYDHQSYQQLDDQLPGQGHASPRAAQCRPGAIQDHPAVDGRDEHGHW